MITNDITVVNRDSDLLAQLAALQAAASQNSALMIILVLSSALFATTECLPFIIRIVHISGPPNTYEKSLRMQELGHGIGKVVGGLDVIRVS